jgi:hypothetical protein
LKSTRYKEANMVKRSKAGSNEEISQADIEIGSSVTESFASWLDHQADVLQSVGAMTKGWFERRQQTMEALWEGWAEIRASREPAEMFRIQQELLTGSLQRLGSDVEAWTALSAALWPRIRGMGVKGIQAAGDAPMLSTAGAKPRRGRPPRTQPGSHEPGRRAVAAA